MLDPSIPLRAGMGGLNLAELFQQSQQLRHGEQLMQQRQAQIEAEAQQQQVARLREQAGQIAQLTRGVGDEATYQQRLAAARAYGIDVSGAPPTYNPEWVQTQNIIAETFFREGPERLTTTAQELQEAGLQPGTPEFQRAMAQRIAMKDSKVVNTTAGGMSGMLGPNGYQPFILPNPGGAAPGSSVGGGAVQVRSEADYNALPPGAVYIDPQGNQRTKGGAGSNVGGTFQP